jgi:hypothetical protein
MRGIWGSNRKMDIASQLDVELLLAAAVCRI